MTGEPGGVRTDACDGTLTIVTLFSTGSKMFRPSVNCDTPYTGPFAFTRGFRLSEATLSARPSAGVPQSHIVTTRLRSTPFGLGGAEWGSSPFAIRSVQSA